MINCLFFQRLNGLCPVSQVKFLSTGVLFTQLVPQLKGLLLGQALLFTLLFDDLNYFFVLCRSAHTNFAKQPFLAFTFIASLQVCPGFWFVGIYKGDFFPKSPFCRTLFTFGCWFFFKGSFFFVFSSSSVKPMASCRLHMAPSLCHRDLGLELLATSFFKGSNPFLLAASPPMLLLFSKGLPAQLLAFFLARAPSTTPAPFLQRAPTTTPAPFLQRAPSTTPTPFFQRIFDSRW